QVPGRQRRVRGEAVPPTQVRQPAEGVGGVRGVLGGRQPPEGVGGVRGVLGGRQPAEGVGGVRGGRGGGRPGGGGGCAGGGSPPRVSISAPTRGRRCRSTGPCPRRRPGGRSGPSPRRRHS